MNRKQLLILLVALVFVGAAGLLLLQQNRKTWTAREAKMGDKVLPNFQPNAVAAIHIKGETELNLVRSNDLWRVRERGGYPANFHQISDVLIKLRELKVVEAETADPADLPRVNLANPGTRNGAGTLIEFMDDKGTVLDSLLLGKKRALESSSPLRSGTGDGRYVLVPGDPRDVLLIADALAALQPNPQPWLNPDFFKAENLKSISLTAPGGKGNWKVERQNETAPWKLLDAQPGEELDTNKLRAMESALSIPRFIDVVVLGSSEATGLDNAIVIQVESFDYYVWSLNIGAKTGDRNRYVTVAVNAGIPTDITKDQLKKRLEKFDEEHALASWIYVVNSWIFDPLLRNRAQILQGYKEGSAEAAASAKEQAPAQGTNAQRPAWTPHVVQ